MNEELTIERIKQEEVGRNLCGYDVIDVIGRGGFSYVLKVVDKDKNEFAIKKPIDAADNPVYDVLAEAYSKLGNECPHIVGFHEILSDEGDKAMLMEYVEGQTIEEIVEEKKKISIKSSLQITSQILSALEYGSSKGIHHADINPRNVIVADKSIKVLDFYHNAVVDKYKELKKKASHYGKYYNKPVNFHEDFSPRILFEGKIEPCEFSDAYSVGKLLYYMIHGEKLDGTPRKCVYSNGTFEAKEKVDKILAQAMYNLKLSEFEDIESVVRSERPFMTITDMKNAVMGLIPVTDDRMKKMSEDYVSAVLDSSVVEYNVHRNIRAIMNRLEQIINLPSKNKDDEATKQKAITYFHHKVIAPSVKTIELMFQQNEARKKIDRFTKRKKAYIDWFKQIQKGPDGVKEFLKDYTCNDGTKVFK